MLVTWIWGNVGRLKQKYVLTEFLFLVPFSIGEWEVLNCQQQTLYSCTEYCLWSPFKIPGVLWHSWWALYLCVHNTWGWKPGLGGFYYAALLTNAAALVDQPRSYRQEPAYADSISTLLRVKATKKFLAYALKCHASAGSMIASVSHGWVGDLWPRLAKAGESRVFTSSPMEPVLHQPALIICQWDGYFFNTATCIVKNAILVPLKAMSIDVCKSCCQ